MRKDKSKIDKRGPETRVIPKPSEAFSHRILHHLCKFFSSATTGKNKKSQVVLELKEGE